MRPDLDGNAIMTLLGVPPGPVVGKAWKFLKELRLEHGPLDRDAGGGRVAGVGGPGGHRVPPDAEDAT